MAVDDLTMDDLPAELVTLYLDGYEEGRLISLVVALRKYLALELRQAKEIVDGPFSKAVVEGVPRIEAERLRDLLQAEGGQLHVGPLHIPSLWERLNEHG